jgi:tetratricopeptide (TPR) repeat protein
LEANPDAVERLASLYENQGDLAAAVETWEYYLTLVEDERTTDLLYHLGLIVAAYQPESALVYLDQSSNEFPSAIAVSEAIRESLSEESAYQYVQTGQVLASLGQWRLASFAFDQATILRPDYLEAWAYLGEALQHIEDTTIDPINPLKKAISLDNRSPLANMFLGLYWQRRGSHITALEYFQQAKIFWSDQPDIYVEQGKSLAALGRLEEAVEMYQQAIELAPMEGKYYSQLAEFCVVYAYQVQELGLPAARLAVQFDNQNPEFLDTMGQVLLNLDDEMNAIKFFQNALRVEPSYALAHFHLGIIYSTREDKDLASYHLQQVLLHSDNLALLDQAERLLAGSLP